MYICVSAYLMNKKSIKISLLRQDIKRNEEKKVNYSNKYFSPFLQHETFFTLYSRFTSIWVGKKVNFFFSKTRICHRLRQSGALQNSNPSSILFSRCAAVTLGCEQHRWCIMSAVWWIIILKHRSPLNTLDRRTWARRSDTEQEFPNDLHFLINEASLIITSPSAEDVSVWW